MVGRGIGGIRESGDHRNKGENGGKRRYYRTRPDIAFTTMSLACFGHNPRCIHWEAAKHVLCYFKLGSAVLLYHLLNVLSM